MLVCWLTFSVIRIQNLLRFFHSYHTTWSRLFRGEASTMHQSLICQWQKCYSNHESLSICIGLEVGHRCWWRPTPSQPRRSIWRYRPLDSSHENFCEQFSSIVQVTQRELWRLLRTNNHQDLPTWFQKGQKCPGCLWGGPPRQGRYPLVFSNRWCTCRSYKYHHLVGPSSSKSISC